MAVKSGKVLAIDPGPTQSAWIILDATTAPATPLYFGIEENQRVVSLVEFYARQAEEQDICAVCEMIACYGMPVGKEVFETVIWIGRYLDRWSTNRPESVPPMDRLTRGQVKIHLCHSAKANDATIRQAILDLYPATGGGKIPQVGIRSKPGPLYGISKDLWATLALGLTFLASSGGDQASVLTSAETRESLHQA